MCVQLLFDDSWWRWSAPLGRHSSVWPPASASNGGGPSPRNTTSSPSTTTHPSPGLPQLNCSACIITEIIPINICLFTIYNSCSAVLVALAPPIPPQILSLLLPIIHVADWLAIWLKMPDVSSHDKCYRSSWSLLATPLSKTLPQSLLWFTLSGPPPPGKSNQIPIRPTAGFILSFISTQTLRSIQAFCFYEFYAQWRIKWQKPSQSSNIRIQCPIKNILLRSKKIDSFKLSDWNYSGV